MRGGDRGVHRHRPVHQAFGISLRDQRLHDRVPRPLGCGPVRPRPYRLPRPKHLRQISPRDPGRRCPPASSAHPRTDAPCELSASATSTRSTTTEHPKANGTRHAGTLVRHGLAPFSTNSGRTGSHRSRQPGAASPDGIDEGLTTGTTTSRAACCFPRTRAAAFSTLAARFGILAVPPYEEMTPHDAGRQINH